MRETGGQDRIAIIGRRKTKASIGRNCPGQGLGENMNDPPSPVPVLLARRLSYHAEDDAERTVQQTCIEGESHGAADSSGRECACAAGRSGC